MKDNNTPECGMHEALVSYLYDESTADETARVEAHLPTCSSCRNELSAFQRVRGMLQSWELEDVPMLRISTDGAKKSTVQLLKELFLALPLWTRSIGAIATAMLVLAVLGTEIRVNRDGFSFRMSMFNTGRPQNTPAVRESDLAALVNRLVDEKQEQQKAELLLKIAEIQGKQGMNSSDLVKLAAQLKEQHVKIDTLERDIDRREGLSLTDLLLSGDSDRGGSASGTGAGQ